MHPPARALAVLLLTTAVIIGGCSGGPPTASVPPVVREVLAAGDPMAAPGQKLELVRYTIQPGTALNAHRHPGVQLAYVESGTLTYTVIEGTVTVHHVDGGSRSIGPGETARIEAGEWIAEDEVIVHFGENAGTEVVVILASSLLDAAEPPAIPVSPSPSP